MTNYQEGTVKMSNASATFLIANAAITGTLPNFAGYFTTIQTTNALIQAAVVQQEADKSGDTVAKKQLRVALIAQTLDVSRRVVAYATNVNNSSLLTLVNYSESDLKRASDQKLVSSCQVVRDNANTNVAVLATYGITAAIITALQTSITNFSNVIPKGRVDTTDSAEATKRLAALLKTLSANWAKIDVLVDMVKTSQPSFYNEYVKVRKVIALGTNTLPLKIKTMNANTGAPEANVTLTLTAVNAQLKAVGAAVTGNVAIVKKTAAGGGAHFKSLANGDYIVIATKAGFKENTINVSVVNGELTVAEINLERA